MLQVALHAHPRIAIPPETWLLMSGYRNQRTFGDLRTPESRERFSDWLLGQRKVRDLGVPPEHLRRLVAEAPPTLGSLLGVVLRSYSERQGKPRWGDKRPTYYRNVGAILRLFPDAQFVHLVRDGRDAVASLKRMPWWPYGIEHTIATWSLAIDLGEKWRQRLGPSTWHELQYERLVADPETELRSLCTFLGEPYDEAMTRPDAVAEVAVPKRKRKESAHHARTGRPMDTARVAAYRSGLEPAEVALMERVAGKRLRRYGYALEGAAADATAVQVVRYRAVDAGFRMKLHRQHAKDLARDALVRQPLAARLDPVPAV